MTQLLDYTLTELKEIVESLNFPKFRAEQLFLALLQGKDYGDKINVSKELILALKEKNIIFQPVKIIKQIGSKDDTLKFLYQLSDGNIIEGVLLNYKFGNTLCVSTQIGCKMNCLFCASSLNGFVRNLTAGEILGQIVAVNNLLKGTIEKRKITNIVLMGSGEPLDNFDNVVKFLSLITNEEGLNYSVRNISVSTCGIPSKIEKLADLGFAVTLCISLHAPNDKIRCQIMPVAKSYPIGTVIEAAKYYYTITNRRVIFEYTLIDGVNCDFNCAKQLAELVKVVPCHINLIKLNEVDGRKLKAPTMESCTKFLLALNKFGASATLRRSLGDDVEGACGQLRNRVLKQAKVDNDKTKSDKDNAKSDKDNAKSDKDNAKSDSDKPKPGNDKIKTDSDKPKINNDKPKSDKDNSRGTN